MLLGLTSSFPWRHRACGVCVCVLASGNGKQKNSNGDDERLVNINCASKLLESSFLKRASTRYICARSFSLWFRLFWHVEEAQKEVNSTRQLDIKWLEWKFNFFPLLWLSTIKHHKRRRNSSACDDEIKTFFSSKFPPIFFSFEFHSSKSDSKHFIISTCDMQNFDVVFGGELRSFHLFFARNSREKDFSMKNSFHAREKRHPRAGKYLCCDELFFGWRSRKHENNGNSVGKFDEKLRNPRRSRSDAENIEIWR